MITPISMKLIQTARLGYEANGSKAPEQTLVSPGLRRTPHANWDAGEVCRRLNLAFAALILVAESILFLSIWTSSARGAYRYATNTVLSSTQAISNLFDCLCT